MEKQVVFHQRPKNSPATPLEEILAEKLLNILVERNA